MTREITVTEDDDEERYPKDDAKRRCATDTRLTP